MRHKRRHCLAAVAALSIVGSGGRAQMPPDIVDLETLIADIELDIRYATEHNFVGEKITGYGAAKCLLTRSAALALARVQTALRELGLTLKVYDCYRPQTAVDHFVRWVENLDDQAMKPEFYPSVDKRNLFRGGYIAARSGHSRASTLDLTIESRDTGAAAVFDPSAPLRSCENPAENRFPDDSLDMGTGYDCFSPLSHTASRDIGPQQRANRLLLKTLMESNGFVNLDEEWWHYTLVDEPYPNRYFDFPIE